MILNRPCEPQEHTIENQRIWKGQCDGFLNKLASHVQAKAFDATAERGVLEEWKLFLRDADARESWQEKNLKSLINCGEKAMGGRAGTAWENHCIRVLKRAPSAPPKISAVRMPIAIERNGQAPPLATLQIEMPNGAGEVFLHPRYTLITQVEPKFFESIRNAWKAALAHTRIQPDHDALFRVEIMGVPVFRIDGASAGGAAAHAFVQAFTKRSQEVYPYVILATCNERGELGGVGSIPEKVEAICKNKQIKMIVVATEGNMLEVEDTLVTLNMQDLIRVYLLNP